MLLWHLHHSLICAAQGLDDSFHSLPIAEQTPSELSIEDEEEDDEDDDDESFFWGGGALP